jgi:hypothetical protein
MVGLVFVRTSKILNNFFKSTLQEVAQTPFLVKEI